MPSLPYRGQKYMYAQEYYTTVFMPRDQKLGGILIYPCPSIHPSGYRYMVCPAISSYSFNILQDVYTHNGGVHVHRILIFIKYSQNDR